MVRSAKGKMPGRLPHRTTWNRVFAAGWIIDSAWKKRRRSMSLPSDPANSPRDAASIRRLASAVSRKSFECGFVAPDVPVVWKIPSPRVFPGRVRWKRHNRHGLPREATDEFAGVKEIRRKTPNATNRWTATILGPTLARLARTCREKRTALRVSPFRSRESISALFIGDGVHQRDGCSFHGPQNRPWSFVGRHRCPKANSIQNRPA